MRSNGQPFASSVMPRLAMTFRQLRNCLLTEMSRPLWFTPMCSTGGQPAFVARWTRFEVSVEDFMSIRIRHRDKNMAETQQPDISAVRPEAMLFSKASYTAIEAMFGVL